MVYALQEAYGGRIMSVEWETFKLIFFDRFFPREFRKAKVDEFINLRQEGMSVNEYSLKFTQFLNYAPSLVSDASVKMICF